MTPELEAQFRVLIAARKTQSEQRPIMEAGKAAARVFDEADESEGRAVTAIGKLSKVKKGEPRFFQLDGNWWLVERLGRKVEVRRAKGRGEHGEVKDDIE